MLMNFLALLFKITQLLFVQGFWDCCPFVEVLIILECVAIKSKFIYQICVKLTQKTFNKFSLISAGPYPKVHGKAIDYANYFMIKI